MRVGKPSRIEKQIRHYEVEESGTEATPSKFHRADIGEEDGIRRTVHARVVRLDEGLAHLAVFDDEGVAFGAGAAEHGAAVEGEVEGFGEGEGGVGEEADLGGVVGR